MKNLKLVETAEQAVQNEYLTIYKVKEIDGVVVKNGKNPNHTVWYWNDGTTYSEDVIGVLYQKKSHVPYEGCPNSNGLIKMEIGKDVTSINGSAFNYCFYLTSVTIPNSITSIGNNAFQYCGSLTSVNYTGTKAQWNAISKGYNWKSGVPSTCIVHCIDGDINI